VPAALGALFATGPSPVSIWAQTAPDEMVVTAVPRERTVGELAQSVTVIRDDTLNRIRAANLGETLANQLGVNSSYFGAGASRPIIRGLAGARVRTLEDGIDSMDAATVSDDHAVSVDPLFADQIEIFRGPTTLLYGSGAVGGVINIVTTRIPVAAPEDGFAGAVEVRGDSVADDRAAALRLDGGGTAFAWHFDASSRDASDYAIPGFARRVPDPSDAFGLLTNSAAATDTASFGASWLGERGFFGAAVNVFDTLYGIPGDDEEPVRIDLQQTRLDLKGGWMDLAGPIEALKVRFVANDYEHVEIEGEQTGTRFTNDAAEARIELLHRPVGRWRGAFGLQLGGREFAAIGAEAFVPPVDTSTLGVFLVEELDLNAWQLSFGGRVEVQDQRPAGGMPDLSDRASSLSIAGVRGFGDGYSIALNFALSERLPVADELYSNGPHLATRAIQIGNPSLRSEASRHLDVGIRRKSGDLTWGVTAFMTGYDDFIYLADTGLTDPDEMLPVFAFEQQGANFRGLEGEVFAPIARVAAGEVDLRLFADYVRAELADGANLPRMPPLRYGARAQYHDERVLVGLEAIRYAAQDRVAGYEQPTAAYTMLNADFRWRLTAPGGAELDFFVNGSNLADEEARKHTSFAKEIAPLPGRNFAVGLRSRF
jgi:iron complex outermembrane receptor protein